MAAKSISKFVRYVALSTTRTILYPVPHHRQVRRCLNTVAPPPSRKQLGSGSRLETSVEEDLATTDIIQGAQSNAKPPMLNCAAPRDLLVRINASAEKFSRYIISAIQSRHNYQHHAGSAGPLILVPTRESATWIAREAQRLTTHRRGFEVQLLVGGIHKDQQEKDWMSSSRDLVVATPGRLRDLLTNAPGFQQGFKGCPMLILDEADTLLSMGYRDDIDAIVSFLPRTPIRRTLLFSATMPRAVRQLASWILSPDHTFMDAPSEPSLTLRQNEEHIAHTKLLPDDTHCTPHDHIKQFYILCPTSSDQLPTLLKLLAHDQLTHGPSSKAIVFCPTAQVAEFLTTLLRSLVEEVLPDKNTKIVKMHSKMKQSDRDRSHVSFRRAEKTQSRRPAVLVTSDVSARGLDFSRVTRVVQIGVPSREAMYTYRIGRMAQGVKNNEPSVRADLLLLPWEAGYMDWKLTSLPIKSLSISALDGQLSSLPTQSSTPTNKSLESTLARILRHIDPADVRSTAASLLGYYLPLTPALRLQPQAVVAGVSSWAFEGFHVSIPTIKRLPKKFTDAYEQSTQWKTKGLFVDGLKLADPTPLGKAKSKNRSVWEGANTRRKRAKWWY